MNNKWYNVYVTIKNPNISDKLDQNGIDLKKPIQVKLNGQWKIAQLGLIKQHEIGVYVDGEHYWIKDVDQVRNKRKEVTKTIATFLCDDGQVRTAVDNGIFKKERYLRGKGIGYEKVEMKKTWEVNS